MQDLIFTDPDELERFQKWEQEVNDNLPKYSERQAKADRSRIALLDMPRQTS